MKAKEIKKIISGRFKELNKSCDKVRKKFAAKDIHKFRTDVKKLRAFIRLISFSPDKPVKKPLPKELRKLYGITGEIRDSQLQLERIKNTHQNNVELKEYADLLNSIIRNNRKKLKKKLSGNLLAASEKKIIKRLPEAFDMKRIVDFAQDKINKMEVLRQTRNNEDDDIHSIRKNLKDVMYAVQMIDDSLKPSFPTVFSGADDKNKMEQLSDQLGLFTDMSAALSYTEPGYIKKVNADEKKQLLLLRTQWLKRKQEIREAVLKELQYINAAPFAV